jgi:DNA-binding transcriptional MerR regulator
MNVFTIRDLENLSGIRAHTIRVWEQRYNLLKPSRTDTNIRYYSNIELKTILNVALLNRHGFKISQIYRMSEGEMMIKVLGLTDKTAKLERSVNELIGDMVDLDIFSFEQRLDLYVLSHGIDKSIKELIFPFLDRIGILWQTNHIQAAQEHLVSNIIRQKLIVGIEGAAPHRRSDRLLVLFLPEGEFHELGLLYVQYLLRIHGAQTLYLGANMPLKDVAYICHAKSPDYLYTHLTGVTGNFNFDRFFGQARHLMPEVPLIVSGQLARAHLKKIPSDINIKRSLPEVLEFVAKL